MMQCDYQFQYARWSVKRVSSTDGELHAQSLVVWSRFEAGAVIRERTFHGTTTWPARDRMFVPLPARPLSRRKAVNFFASANKTFISQSSFAS
jgi:hypothetical protein